MLSCERPANIIRRKSKSVGEPCWAPDDDGVAGGGAQAGELSGLGRHQVVEVQADLAEVCANGSGRLLFIFRNEVGA